NSHAILQAAEQGLNEASQKEPSPVRITLHLPEGKPAPKKEVVLIDPDEELLNIMKSAFEFHGFAVKTFTDGEHALNALLAYNEAQIPALIISERKLPDMDGF